MWLPFICLLAGALMSRWLARWAAPAMTLSLFVLLFSLGGNIGVKPQLIASIPRLGAAGFMFFLLASLGSMAAGYVLERAVGLRVITSNPGDDGNGASDARKEFGFMAATAGCVAAGIMAGRYLPMIPGVLYSQLVTAALVVIFVSIGLGIREGMSGLAKGKRMLLYVVLPLALMAGSLLGGLIAGWLTKTPWQSALAISGGMGYYSVTSPIVTRYGGADLGFVAFFANFLREALTFFITPLLIRVSRFSPIALAGATTMDTTLGIMRRYLGEELALGAFMSGVILTLLVPLFEAFIYVLK